METEIMLDEKNVMTMKLLHYFITEKNYNPIILQGVDNEIWLENLNEDCKVIRIVSGYIHNDEQLKFDIFKTKRILNKIKKKTFSISMNVMSIFLDMNDSLNSTTEDTNKMMFVNVHDEKDIEKSEKIKELFPDLVKKMEYSEEGFELFAKITSDINKHNREDAKKVEKVFKTKKPYVTYFLIAACVIFYFVPLLSGHNQEIIDLYCIHGPSIRNGDYYRIITGIFLHGSLLHLLFNCYTLYIFGSQIENFLGKVKYLIIYFFAGICGALLSITLSFGVGSIGASGAIFGLMGSLVYFGYHYRVYLGNVVKSQLLPMIALNLFLGFVTPGIDNWAHIGGLIGGSVITMALGVENKSTQFEKTNGWIIAMLVLAFFSYMGLIFAGR